MSKLFKYNDFFLSKKEAQLRTWADKNPLGQVMFPINSTNVRQVLTDYFQKMGQYAWINTRNYVEDLLDKGKEMPPYTELEIIIENYEDEWARTYGLPVLGIEDFSQTDYRGRKLWESMTGQVFEPVPPSKEMFNSTRFGKYYSPQQINAESSVYTNYVEAQCF